MLIFCPTFDSIDMAFTLVYAPILLWPKEIVPRAISAVPILPTYGLGTCKVLLTIKLPFKTNNAAKG
jgi:hypothetical protein